MSSSSSSTRAAVERKGHVGPFTLGVIISIVLLAAVWFGWTPASQAAHAWLARRNAAQARQAIDSQDWSNAYRLLAEARRQDAHGLEVIETAVEFFKATKSDPAALAQQLRQLQLLRPLSDDETLLLGRSLMASGKVSEARKMFESLPVSISSRPQGLQLLSEILAVEGHTKESGIISRQATAGAVAAREPEALLKANKNDLSSAFPEIRTKAHSALWDLAERSDQSGLEAINSLAASGGLVKSDADKLLQMVEKHPLATLMDRFNVVAVFARLQPELAPTIWQKEVDRFQQTGQGNLEELALALMKQGQNDLVFSLVPTSLALKSRVLYPVLMQCMGQAKRWKDLRQLLMVPNPPVPRSLVDLALAEVQALLEPDMRESRRLLEGTIKTATAELNSLTLERAAELAVKLNQPDLAAKAYFQAGLKNMQVNNLELASKLLQKGMESALAAKDANVLLDVSQKLFELSPASRVYADRLAYLRLVLGVEMETVTLAAAPETSASALPLPVVVERVPPALLQALSAYRLGDMESMKSQLATLKETAALPAGQRAVAAGLLALAGRPDRAYQVAEKVPDALLLQEELVFLNHAR